MKHLGWDLRIDDIGAARLTELKSGKKATIYVFTDEIYCFPEELPWRVVNWAIRKTVEVEMRLMREEAELEQRNNNSVWSGENWDSDAILIGKRGGSLGSTERLYIVSTLMRGKVDETRAFLETLAILTGQVEIPPSDTDRETFAWRKPVDPAVLTSEELRPVKGGVWNGKTFDDITQEIADDDTL